MDGDNTTAPPWLDSCPEYIRRLHSHLSEAQIAQLGELLGMAKVNDRGKVSVIVVNGKPRYVTLELTFEMRKI